MPAQSRKIKKITTVYMYAFDIESFKAHLVLRPTLTI